MGSNVSSPSKLPLKNVDFFSISGPQTSCQNGLSVNVLF